MPTWRTELPPEGKNRGYDLKRTPTSAPLIAIITSTDLLVCDTHYWHGRTTPCERQCNAEGRTIDDTQCPACGSPEVELHGGDDLRVESFDME